MKTKFFTVDAFTNSAFQGTQVLVFPSADEMSDDTMLSLSQEFGFPDTVFVTKASSSNYAAKFRCFTRSGETSFEGHSTIGAAFTLYSQGYLKTIGNPQRFAIEEGVGPIEIIINQQDNAQLITEFVVQTNPTFDTYVPSTSELARILSLEPSKLQVVGYEPLITHCDRAYLIVPIAGAVELQNAVFSSSAWVNSPATSTMPRDILVFSPADNGDNAHFYARLLGETISSDEDPPIGSAMPAFASYLAESGLKNKTFTIERGVGRNRLSTLNVHLDKVDDSGVTVRVGGSVVTIAKGEIEI